MFYYRVEWTNDKWGDVQFKMFIFERNTKNFNNVICIEQTPSLGQNIFFDIITSYVNEGEN